MMRTMGLIHLSYIILAVQEGSNDISITFNFPDTYFHQDNFYILQNHTFASGNKSFGATSAASQTVNIG